MASAALSSIEKVKQEIESLKCQNSQLRDVGLERQQMLDRSRMHSQATTFDVGPDTRPKTSMTTSTPMERMGVAAQQQGRQFPTVPDSMRKQDATHIVRERLAPGSMYTAEEAADVSSKRYRMASPVGRYTDSHTYRSSGTGHSS